MLETKSVLVAQQDRLLCTTIATMLTAEGFTPYPVINYGQFNRALRNFKPDCIILGVDFTPINGVEVAMRLTQSKKFRDVPRIFVTAYKLLQVPEMGILAKGVVSKPFEYDDLIDSVQKAINPYDEQRPTA